MCFLKWFLTQSSAVHRLQSLWSVSGAVALNYPILWLAIVSCPFYVNGQMDTISMAKLYFEEAQKHYAADEFDDALFFVSRIDSLVVGSGSVLNLKIKAYYHSGCFNLAKNALKKFEKEYLGSVPEVIEEEALSYFGPIEKGLRDSVEQRMAKKKMAKALDSILKNFKSETCTRCSGKGEYTFSKKFEYRIPRRIKNKAGNLKTCEICHGWGTWVIYNEHDSISQISPLELLEFPVQPRLADEQNTEGKVDMANLDVVVCKWCDGLGHYFLTTNYFGNRPRWAKNEKPIHCEVCLGKGRLLKSPKNDSIFKLPKQEFMNQYRRMILGYLALSEK